MTARPTPTPTPTPTSLAFVTLGCPKNQVDSEAMLGLLAKDGFRPTGRVEDAELVVVNTCAFLSSAVDESRKTIRSIARLKKHGRLKGLVVAGCWAQRAGTATSATSGACTRPAHAMTRSLSTHRRLMFTASAWSVLPRWTMPSGSSASWL